MQRIVVDSGRRGQQTDSFADTEEFIESVLELNSGQEVIQGGTRSGNIYKQRRRNSFPPELQLSGHGSELAVGAEACVTPSSSRPISARKLLFDSTISPVKQSKSKRGCLKSLNEMPAKSTVVFTSDGRTNNEYVMDSINSEDTIDDDARITQSLVHKYVDSLNEIFSKAQLRIDNLNLMCIASAELDKFAINMDASTRSAQFANIDNLSVEECRHLLRAEMLRNEQNDNRVELLTKRNTQLEKRLAVTDTAEKHYSFMKMEMEKKMKILLEEFAEMERKRIERCNQLVERNNKLEKRHSLNTAQNETLNGQIRVLEDKLAKIRMEHQKSERDERGLRCQVDSLQETLDSQRNENKALRNRIDELQRQFSKNEQICKDLEDKLKSEQIKCEGMEECSRRLDENRNKEREISDEKLKTTEKNMGIELDRKREQYESDLFAISQEYEKNLLKAKEEISRVKQERDGLVMKLCDVEHSGEKYKHRILANAQKIMLESCQKAFDSDSGKVDQENVYPQLSSTAPSARTTSGVHSMPHKIQSNGLKSIPAPGKAHDFAGNRMITRKKLDEAKRKAYMLKMSHE